MMNRIYLKDLRADLLFVWEWRSELPITARKKAYELAQHITKALNTNTALDLVGRSLSKNG